MRKGGAFRESDILDYIENRFSGQKDKRLLLGPGDDAAVIKTAGGEILVATTDEMVEETHFRDGGKYPELVARKILRINLSDLAAMGAVKPLACLAGGAFPKNFPASWIKRFTRALGKECAAFGLSLAGGNLSRSSVLHVYAAVLGEADERLIVKRRGAKPGELIMNAGPLGDSKAGLEIFLSGKPKNRREKKLLGKFWLPEPMLKEGALLAEHGLATCMLDNSDGLLRSCRIISRASGVSAEILPDPKCVSRELLRYCAGRGRDWRRYAVSGGEDYGLIFTAKPGDLGRIRELIPRATVVGRTGKGKGVKTAFLKGGAGSFEHF